MTLEEAIRANKEIKKSLDSSGQIDWAEAVGLGTEALITIKAERLIYGFKRQVRLPGETEE